MHSDVELSSIMGTVTTREDALRRLESGSPHERLRGARFFAKNARTRDLAMLKRLYLNETDSYVMRTLDLAIRRSTPSDVPRIEQSPENVGEEINHKVRNDAIEWIAGILLHEIASPLGLIAEAASRELPGYDKSQLKTRITNLQRIFEGIEQLKSAISPPRLQHFDLSSWLESVMDAENLLGVSVAFQGAKPFLIDADPRLLRFAVCNGMKNALEAVQGYLTTEAYPLIVTWGGTDC